MWAALLSPLNKIGSWFVGLVLKFVFGLITDWAINLQKKRDDEKKAKANPAKLAEVLKTGKDDEIEKQSLDTLNGN